MNTHEEDMRQIAEAIQLEAADCGRFMGTPLEKSLAARCKANSDAAAFRERRHKELELEWCVSRSEVKVSC